jgi:hypothetical protein
MNNLSISQSLLASNFKLKTQLGDCLILTQSLLSVFEIDCLILGT